MDKRIQTINELQVSFQASLEALRDAIVTRDAALAKEILLPDGLTPVVELVHESGRRKRGDAAARNWNPQSDKIVISYRPISAKNETISAIPAAGNAQGKEYPHPTSAAISLNRSIPTPEVPPRFQPVAISGEAASTTLLRDRGSI